MNIEEISWTEFSDAKPSLALLPTGSTEQHGPHGPMATDTIIAKAIAARAAEETETLLLPTINIGISREHSNFPGSLSLSPKTFRSQLEETVLSAHDSGIDKFVVVNGHGGNISAIQETCKNLYYDHDIEAIEWTWFNAISTSEMGHAGKLETSLIMYLREDLIGKPIEPGSESWGLSLHGSRWDYDTKKFSENGVVGDPREATKKEGKKLFDNSLEKLIKLIKSMKDENLTTS